MATNAEQIKSQILQLPDEELKAFRAWYEQFDSDRWDRQIETDVLGGNLDKLASEALGEHAAGKSRRL